MERSTAIDLLRTAALFLVCFGRHLTHCPPSTTDYIQARVHELTIILSRGGWIGVDLFFVLSGFLVSGLLFREYQKFGSISGKRFLIRRGFRIYPAFWLLIIATVVVEWIQKNDIGVKATIAELVFLQNYGPFLWWHTWSLAVEEHFYLLLIALLLFLAYWRSRKVFAVIPSAFIGLALLSLAVRIATADALEYGHKTHLFPSHLRMDSLFFGVVISYFYHFRSARFLLLATRYRWVLVAISIVTLAPAFVFKLETSPFIYTVGLSLFYIGSGCLLIASVAVALPKTKLVTWAAHIGSHSYSIYLWHGAVALWLIPLFRQVAGGYWSWPVYAVTYFVCSLAIGITMALLIEFPTLRIRDRLFPSLVRPLSVAPIKLDHTSEVVRRRR